MINKRNFSFLLLLLPAFLLTLSTVLPAIAAPIVQVTDLRCDYRTDPLGIRAAQPRLSWILPLDKRGERQTAYRVLVSSSPDALEKEHGDLWDSGKIASDQSIQQAYRGQTLMSGMHCYWKVRVWDMNGKPCSWSKSASWSMGLLRQEDWQARWIGYDAAYHPDETVVRNNALFTTQGLRWVRFPSGDAKPVAIAAYFRKRFVLPADRKVTRAVFTLYADNQCEAAVNGVLLGQAARWEKSARLEAGSALHAGANVASLSVTNTDAMPAAVVGKLVVQFDSGADMILPLDGSWKAARQASGTWQAESFDDKAWPAAEPFDGMPWHGPPSLADIPRMPAPYLRKTFAVSKPIRRATAYVTALGLYELHLNGRRIGQDVFTPGWTEYRKRVAHQTYDVTSLIQQGDNCVGGILGDGWYAGLLAHLGRRNFYGGPPRLLVQILIEHADGSTQTVISDGSWKASFGPIRHADLLLGCEYDARLALAGWDTSAFNDTAWSPVVEGATLTGSPKPGMQVEPAVTEPSRRLEQLHTVKLTEPRPGCYTFDLGQNMVGWVRLKVRGAAGQRITVRHGEMLNPDGTIYTAGLRSATATDFYTLADSQEATLEPYFTFHGFRYVEVSGLTAKPDAGMVTGIVVHSDMRRTGEFACSSPLVNRLYQNIIWGQKGNHLEIPTDCPQRDERMGWTGDTQFFAPTGAYNYDVAGFFTRWLTICEDDQLADGSFPHVVPDIMGGGGATAWGDAALLCTYNVYRAYADTHVVADHFAAMERYLRFVEARSKNFIPNVGGFGDWLNLGGGASREVIDTAYYAHLARLMSEMAAAIGRKEDATRYAVLRDHIQTAFAGFFNEDGSIKDSSQTGYALAFSMGLVPDALREKATEKYVEEIKRFDWHLATGFIGTPRLLPALNAAGRDDVAYRLLLQDTYPSWLYQVKLGATTMWERWNGWTPEGGFGDVSMNSFNHYAFGAVGEYLYGAVGGINASSPGYKAIRIQPVIRHGLTWAKTRFVSMYGPIVSDWKRKGGRLTLDITIPANTTATVIVPAHSGQSVTESGTAAARAQGVHFLRADHGAAVFTVEPGVYHFSAPAE